MITSSTALGPLALTILADAILESWDFTGICQQVMVGEHPSPDQASAMAIEYQRYITLCAGHPEMRFAIPKALDPFWRAHLLDADDYHEMCMAVNEERLIERQPFPSGTDRGQIHQDYVTMLQFYRDYYEEDPPAEFWSEPTAPSDAGNCQESDYFADCQRSGVSSEGK
jgi:hypothetical protein